MYKRQIVFLSLAAAAAVLTLGLHSRTLSALAGVLMAAFPCLGYTFLYMFTASAYCLAILLAVLSVLSLIHISRHFSTNSSSWAPDR